MQSVKGSWSLEKIFIIVSAVVLGITLLNPSRSAGDVYYVFLWPLAMFAIISIRKKFTLFEVFRNTGTSQWITTALMTVLFLLMSPITEIIDLPCFNISEIDGYGAFLLPFNILYYATATVSLFTCVLFGIKLSSCLGVSPEKDAARQKKIFWICFTVTVVFSVAYALCGWPGILDEDSTFMWHQITEEGYYTEWHTMGYELILIICSSIWNFPLSVVIVQTVLFIFTNYVILRTLLENKGDKACVTYTVLSLTVGIMSYKYLPVLYKDVFFAIALVGFCVCVWRLAHRISVFNVVSMCLFSVVATNVRHGGIIVIILGLVALSILLVAKRKKIKPLCATAIVLAITLLSSFGMGKVADHYDAVENPAYVTYTIPMYMMGVYAASGYEMSEETIATLEEIRPISDWIYGYNIDNYYADTITREWGHAPENLMKLEDKELQKAFLKANWEFFSRHPFAYAEGLFNVTSIVWEMSRPMGPSEEWLINHFDNSSMSGQEYFPEWYPAEHSVLRDILEPITGVIFEIAPWRMVSYRGGLCLWMLIYIAIIMFKRNKAVSIAIFPLLVYAATLMLSCPAPMPRYILPFTMAIPFVLSVVFVKSRKNVLFPTEEMADRPDQDKN